MRRRWATSSHIFTAQAQGEPQPLQRPFLSGHLNECDNTWSATPHSEQRSDAPSAGRIGTVVVSDKSTPTVRVTYAGLCHGGEGCDQRLMTFGVPPRQVVEVVDFASKVVAGRRGSRPVETTGNGRVGQHVRRRGRLTVGGPLRPVLFESASIACPDDNVWTRAEAVQHAFGDNTRSRLATCAVANACRISRSHAARRCGHANRSQSRRIPHLRLLEVRAAPRTRSVTRDRRHEVRTASASCRRSASVRSPGDAVRVRPRVEADNCTVLRSGELCRSDGSRLP